MSSGGPKEIYSENLYVLEYLSDNCYVIFNEWMQSFGSKGLGAWGADEILSILKTFFMLIPSLSFLDFVLWKLKLFELWPLSLLWQASLWAPRCGLGVNQGLFCGSIQSV